jgi:hypothetical protein
MAAAAAGGGQDIRPPGELVAEPGPASRFAGSGATADHGSRRLPVAGRTFGRR